MVNLSHPRARLIVGVCKDYKLPLKQAAYVLATAWHESGAFKYMREIWGPTPAQKRYEGRKDLGNTERGDGKRYMGRGFCQITGRRNYADWSKRLGLDLLKTPQLAEQPEIAAKILVEGMKLGTFTKKKLADYITDKRTDYLNARRIINGTDKKALIAGYAKEYETILAAEGYSATGKPADAPKPKPAPVEPPKPKPAPAPKADANIVIKLGDKGKYVEDLQNHLNTLGFGPLTVSGEFDKATDDAVRTFQRMNKLMVDGKVGLRTSAAIGEALKAQEIAPELEEAKKVVPPTATEEVKSQSNFWTWITGAGGAAVTSLFGGLSDADWTSILAIGGVSLSAVAILLWQRHRIIAAFKEINAEARK